jgi:hypothetical protein
MGLHQNGIEGMKRFLVPPVHNGSNGVTVENSINSLSTCVSQPQEEVASQASSSCALSS